MGQKIQLSFPVINPEKKKDIPRKKQKPMKLNLRYDHVESGQPSESVSPCICHRPSFC